MKRFLPGICAAALASAFSFAGLGSVNAAPSFVPQIAVAKADVIEINDGEGIGRDGARIIRRDRHRERRGERSHRRHHESQKQVRRHHEGQKQTHRRYRDKRFAHRHKEGSRLGYNRPREGERLGYNRRQYKQDRYAHRGNNGPKFLYRDRDDRRYRSRDNYYGENNWDRDGYRHKRRLYKMESYGYKGTSYGDAYGHSGKPQGGRLKDILTAVPN